MNRLILDTQCLLSAISGYHQDRETSLASIWAAFRRREVVLVFSEASLSELQRVLDYPGVTRLNITSGQAFAAASQLLMLGEYHAPVPSYSWPSLTDKKDWFLLDLLYHSEADALISRDKRVLEAGVALGLPVREP
ncbi:hypothetical protein Dxin01_03860 [Deinococcus xinjiangensis]|uniref:PIN domain-containing protein n=1 Tax=Deinococcus xinjiangensis TaxID=457454 RepID=A0ABP9VFU3_9DEIO